MCGRWKWVDSPKRCTTQAHKCRNQLTGCRRLHLKMMKTIETSKFIIFFAVFIIIYFLRRQRPPQDYDERHSYSRVNWYAPIKFWSLWMPVDPLMWHLQPDCSCRLSTCHFRFDASRCNAHLNRPNRIHHSAMVRVYVLQNNHRSESIISWARPRGQYVCHSHIDRCDRRTLVSCPMTNDVCNQQRQLQLHHMSKSIMFTWVCTTNYTIPTDHPLSRPHKITERVGIAPNISFDLCVHGVHNLVHAKYNK